MKKYLIAFAFSAFLFAGCNKTTEKTETTITETETVIETDTIDPEITEIDNTRVEIEEASDKVDSLLNKI